jgi:dTDP-4-amino-4,6-dideoxy-D-glucose acyltransferase
MSVLSAEQVKAIGFRNSGSNVAISDKASFYNPSNISIGSNVRIDDFCVLSAGSGGIELGSNIHIAVFSSLIGTGKMQLCDFANISSRVSIYSSNDDYSGEYLTNPTVPKEFTGVRSADVFIGRHVIIGSGSIVLPGLRLEDGAAVGALSLVNHNCEAFGIYVGIPAKRIKDRKRDLLELEQEYLATMDTR